MYLLCIQYYLLFFFVLMRYFLPVIAVVVLLFWNVHGVCRGMCGSSWWWRASSIIVENNATVESTEQTCVDVKALSYKDRLHRSLLKKKGVEVVKACEQKKTEKKDTYVWNLTVKWWLKVEAETWMQDPGMQISFTPMHEEEASILTDIESDINTTILTWPCRPPYLCVEISAERRKWRDGTIKWTLKADDWAQSHVQTLLIRSRWHDEDCDDTDQNCDGWRIIIEADVDGDGEREPLLPLEFSNKETPKNGTGTTVWVWKKEYVGHVSLMK